MIYEIGFPKTATRSVMHGVCFLRHLNREDYRRTIGHGATGAEHQEVIARLIRGGPPPPFLWKRFYSGGLPVAWWQTFAQRRPDAKFILTIRPVDSWWKSVAHRMSSPSGRRRATSLVNHRPLTFITAFRLRLFGSVLPYRPVWPERYERHNQQVIDYFADANRSDNLLIFNPWDGDGWEQLCPFLGYPIPDVEFPKTRKGNPRKKIRDLVQQLRMKERMKDGSPPPPPKESPAH